jgi:hypothetical protein
VQPDGALAASELGLTTQVPVQPTWLTSGRGRTTRIGRQTLRFVHDSALPPGILGTPAGQVLAALRWLGPEGAPAADLARLRRKLSPVDKRRLARVARDQPAWLRAAVERLADGA